jgi:hypothetical protein
MLDISYAQWHHRTVSRIPWTIHITSTSKSESVQHLRCDVHVSWFNKPDICPRVFRFWRLVSSWAAYTLQGIGLKTAMDKNAIGVERNKTWREELVVEHRKSPPFLWSQSELLQYTQKRVFFSFHSRFKKLFKGQSKYLLFTPRLFDPIVT